MTDFEIRDMIKREVFTMSSKKWQYDAWSHFNPKSWYDPDEQIVDYLSSCDFSGSQEQMQEYMRILSKEEFELLKKLNETILQYIKKYDNTKESYILDDPEYAFYKSEPWKEFRGIAIELYELMEKNDKKK